MPSILQEAIGATRQNLDKANEEVSMIISKCVIHLSKLYREEEVGENDVIIKSGSGDIRLVKFTLNLPENFTVDDAHFLRDYIILHKQEQIYIR